MTDKTKSGHAAIKEYMAHELFDEWVTVFAHTLRWPRHRDAVLTSVGYELPFQFNRSPAGWSVSSDLIREVLNRTVPAEDPERWKKEIRNYAYARWLLNISEDREQAHQYPDIVLALALYQAAHRPFLERFRSELATAHQAGKITDIELGRGQSVLSQLLEQAKAFNIFRTYLMLIFLERDTIRLDNQELEHQALTEQAMKQAGKLLAKMFATDFGPAGVMVCPAKQHILHAIGNQTFPRLHQFVLANQNTPLIQKLLRYTTHSAWQAVMFPHTEYKKFETLPFGETLKEIPAKQAQNFPRDTYKRPR